MKRTEKIVPLTDEEGVARATPISSEASIENLIVSRFKNFHQVHRAWEYVNDYLSEAIHDIKSSEAATINNDGVDSQVLFLLESGFTQEAIGDMIKDALSMENKNPCEEGEEDEC